MLLNKFRQFMIGRYGMDQLNNTLVVSYLIVSFISILFGRKSYGLQLFCMVVTYALLFVVLFRMFSKNYNKRNKENMKFLAIITPLRGKMNSRIRRLKQMKTHRFFKCSRCGQVIRVPRGKGKISIRCPKCNNEFIKKT